jgi:putative hydrolase of HD superfamily
MKNIANFLFEAGMLKRTPRTGFQFLGSGAESVAEHIFRTSMIGYTLAQLDEEADAGRVVLLCLFHDIPEARTGDLNYVNKKYVKVDERKAVEDLARTPLAMITAVWNMSSWPGKPVKLILPTMRISWR